MALKVKGKHAVDLLQGKSTGVDYGGHFKVEPVKGIVTVEKKHAKEESGKATSESTILHPGVMHNGYEVRVGGGRTLNLGNYESARIDVWMTVPCDADSFEQAYQMATEWVSEKIEEAVKLAKGE